MAADTPTPADVPTEEERTICFCHNVPASRILEIIRAGATSLGEIQDQCFASTGCGGCECDVLEILEQELSKPKPKAG